jgi:DNA-binding MltR family transcriptional regulator
MWFALDQNTINALDELEKGPDRTVGVVAGAIVESYLTEILKRELTPDDSDYTKEIQNYTFQPDGPLGNFGAKIWVAYLLGYFSKKAHVDLLNFKHIRNLFAHYSEHNSFQTQKIRDRCSNFTLINELVRGPMATRSGGGISASMDSMMYSKSANTFHLNMVNHDEVLKVPKGRFITTVKLLCAAFELFGQGNLRKPIL